MNHRQVILLLHEEGMTYKEILETIDFNEAKSASKEEDLLWGII